MFCTKFEITHGSNSAVFVGAAPTVKHIRQLSKVVFVTVNELSVGTN